MRLSPRVARALGVGSRFLAVGALSTVIEVVAFNLLIGPAGWDVLSAKIAASLIALVNAYFGNREWTFRGRDRRRRGTEVALFLATNAVCTALGAALVWGGVALAASALGHEPGLLLVNLVNLVSIAVVVVVRFVLYHVAVFRAAPRDERAGRPD